jgi:FMN phosphatase YigB (HAD superfamily)
MTAVAIRAVLFDLGDTLWHFPKMPPFEHIRGETVRRVSNLLRWWGVEPAGELFFLGRDIRIAVEQAERDAYADHCLSPDYAGIAQQVAAAKGLHISRRQAEHLWEVWNLGGSFFDRTLHDDVLPTLTWLRDRGYRLGAVSNRMYGGPRFHAELRDMGLDSLFEALAISCEVGHMKPHPAIFLRAVGALGGGLLLLLVLVAVCATQGRPPPPDPALELARQLPGFPHQIDPVALLPAVRKAAGATRPLRLVSIKARYAGAQGLVDLDGPGYQGAVEYLFRQEAPPEPPPAGPRPPRGARRTAEPILTTDWSLSLNRDGLTVRRNIFAAGFSALVPDPSCSVRQVWVAARAAGAPARAVARLEYQSLLGGQAGWSFEIDGTGFEMKISDPGCRRRTAQLDHLLRPTTGAAAPAEQPTAE